MTSPIARIASRLVGSPAARRFALAALVGALGFSLFGDTPASQRTPDPGRGDFTLPAPPAAPEAAVGALAAAPVWVSQPQPAAAVADAVPIYVPPRLLGILESGGRREALLLFPDGRRLRATPGERLPDGGAVTRLGATTATLTLPDGNALDLRLLAGPPSR